ncbi:hypothetical protein FACS1894170_08280 [Planctomycetales bacterium]|nr:hypothetical protein FACS1894170_08280 [Planctomycetales bacterium]
MAPWIKYRSEQGYSVDVIVEPFGTGTVTPQRIKERIAEVHRRTPLCALLLVGRSVPAPLLPCRIIGQFGTEQELASDDWYTDLDGDGLPNFPVGRFSVELDKQLDTVIGKTIQYESLPAETWCKRIQLVAGVGNFSPMLDGVIESSARYIFSEAFTPSYDISLLHADWQSSFCPFPSDFQAELRRTFDAGSLFWVYLGHGKHRDIEPLYLPQGYYVPLTLLEPSKPQGLPPTIALLFCCYGGCLDNDTPSIAEELVLTQNAVAAVSPSRTAMPYGMSVLAVEMLQTFVRYQNAGKPLTLGQLLHESKYRTLNPVRNAAAADGKRKNRPVRETVESLAKMFDPNPQYLREQLEEHTAMFHLFGDPLLRLPIPQRLEWQCAKQIRSGQWLHISGRTANDCNGVDLELTLPLYRISLRSAERQDFHNDTQSQQRYNEEYVKANRLVLQRYHLPCKDGVFDADIALPGGLSGEYILRGFVQQKTGFSVGSCVLKSR